MTQDNQCNLYLTGEAIIFDGDLLKRQRSVGKLRYSYKKYYQKLHFKMPIGKTLPPTDECCHYNLKKVTAIDSFEHYSFYHANLL